MNSAIQVKDTPTEDLPLEDDYLGNIYYWVFFSNWNWWGHICAGVDFNIEAADENDTEPPPPFLEELALPLPEVPDSIPEVPDNLPVEEKTVNEAATVDATSATANVPPDLSVNGIDSIESSPSPVKKKRLYQRRPSSKPENKQLESQPVVQLPKLSPNSFSTQPNGEIGVPPKRRTVNGPMFRNKHIIKKKVVKPKATVRKAEVKESKVEAPSTLSEESDFVECVRCAAVVEVANVRHHLTVCSALATSEENGSCKEFFFFQ